MIGRLGRENLDAPDVIHPQKRRVELFLNGIEQRDCCLPYDLQFQEMLKPGPSLGCAVLRSRGWRIGLRFRSAADQGRTKTTPPVVCDLIAARAVMVANRR